MYFQLIRCEIFSSFTSILHLISHCEDICSYAATLIQSWNNGAPYVFQHLTIICPLIIIVVRIQWLIGYLKTVLKLDFCFDSSAIVRLDNGVSVQFQSGNEASVLETQSFVSVCGFWINKDSCYHLNICRLVKTLEKITLKVMFPDSNLAM